MANVDQNQHKVNSDEYGSPQPQDHASLAQEFVLVSLRLVGNTVLVGTSAPAVQSPLCADVLRRAPLLVVLPPRISYTLAW